MRQVGFFALRRGFDARAALLIAVAALIAGGAAALMGDSARAQTIPEVYAQYLTGGAVDSDPLLKEVGDTAYHHVELRVGTGTNSATPVTYATADISRIDILIRRGRSGATPVFWDGVASRSGKVAIFASDGTTAGSRLTECDGIYGDRCEFLPAEWKALAGQTGEPDATTNVGSIKFAFTLPSDFTNDEVSFEAVLYPNAGGSAWSYSRWSTAKYQMLIVPTDANDNPFFIRHSTSSEDYDWLQYPFAAGQLSYVRLGIGTGHGEEALTYDKFDNALLQIWARSPAPYNSLNSDGSAHEGLYFTTAGAPLAACSGDSGGCRITETEWRALAGQTGAAADAPIKPIRFAFKVPRRFGTTPVDYNGAQINFGVQLNTPSGLIKEGYTTQLYDRLSAHISRLQTSYINSDGDHVQSEPGANDMAEDDKHRAMECRPEDVDATPTSDCTRNLEVGESVYLENILRLGGADADANDGRTASVARASRADSPILYLDAAKHGAIFDRVRVQATIEAGTPPAPVPGGGVVAISSLCPIGPSNEPEHTSALGNVPRARTVEGLATCEYRYNGGSYWGGKGVNFFPTAAAGTVVTITLSYHKGVDDTSTMNVDESLVARDTLPITVAAAADNTDTGNGGSSWDESDVVAELGQRSREDSLVLLIGHRRNRGIPEFWGGLTSPTGPGSIKGATYATVSSTAAVALTVPAGGGRLSLLGTDKSCTAGSSACTLTLTRNDLKQAALRGGPNPDPTLDMARAATVADIADAAPYWPARLHFKHATPKDVTISGVLTLADGTTTHNFSYVAKGIAASTGPIVAWLPEDADDTLAPSQTAKVAIGYKVPEAASGDDSWRIWNPTPQFYEVTGYTGVDPNPTVELVGTPADPLPVAANISDTYLQLTGPAVWSDTGGRRLRLDRTDYTYYKCVTAASRSGDASDTGRFCYISDASGNAPSVTIASDASADISVTAGDVPLWTMFGDVAPNASHSGGPNFGYFRAMNVHSSERFDVFGSATLRVAAIEQLSSIALGRKPGADGVVPTTPIRIGSSSDLRLSLFNANGQASQLSAVSSIVVTVVGGGTLSGYGCTNATSCTISTTTGTLFDAAKSNPSVVAAIDLTYNAPTRPGSASIRATVVGTDGATYPGTVDLTISGSATELAVGGTLLRVHSSATDGDDRDKIRIPITAQDANGNKARMPQNAAATVRGVGNAALPSGSHTAAVTCTNESRLTCHIEIVVTATASQPLASGAYTATVTGTGLSRTEASFAVGGPAETLSISVPGTLPGLAQTFTATVSVVDKAGVPVADGTWVVFETAATGGGSPSAVVTSPGAEDVDHDGNAETPAVSQRRVKTKNGEVSASVTVVGNGITVLTATAGSKQDSKPLDTRAAAAPEAVQTGPVLEYNTQSGEAATSSWAVYRGGAVTTADELLGHADAPADASIVWLWNGVEWIRYGEADGTALPGSQRFFILPDDTVWFGD